MRTLFYLCPLTILIFNLALFQIPSLERLPGLNLDEAFFIDQTTRLLNGEWSFFGMNTHTIGISSYLVAPFFWVFDESILIYRYAHLFFWTAALITVGLCYSCKNTRFIFFCLAFSFPAPWLNARFGIEVTSIVPFLAATAVFLMTKSFHLSAAAILALAVMTHPLALCIPMALIACAYSQGENLAKYRRPVVLFVVLSAPFFLQMLWTSKWKVKALGVLIFYALLIIATKRPKIEAGFWRLWNMMPGRFILALISLPAIVNFFLFFEGTWIQKIYLGSSVFPGFQTAAMLSLILVVFASRKRRLELRDRGVLVFAFVTMIACQYLTVTHAPKSFQIPMVGFLCVVASMVNKFRFGFQYATLALVVVASFLTLHNVTSPRRLNSDTSFSFGLIKDSSFDFLPNHRLVEELKSMGCALNDNLFVRDPRLARVIPTLWRLDKNELSASGACTGKKWALWRARQRPDALLTVGSGLFALEPQ